MFASQSTRKMPQVGAGTWQNSGSKTLALLQQPCENITTNCGRARYLQNLAMLLQRCLVAYAAGARKKRIAITCRPHRLLTEAVAQCDAVHADHCTTNLHRHLSFTTTALSHRQYHLLHILLYMCVERACRGGHHFQTLQHTGWRVLNLVLGSTLQVTVVYHYSTRV